MVAGTRADDMLVLFFSTTHVGFQFFLKIMRSIIATRVDISCRRNPR